MNKYFDGYTSEQIEDTDKVIEIATTPLTRITSNNNGDYTLYPSIHKTQKGCLCLTCYYAIMDMYWSEVNGEE